MTAEEQQRILDRLALLQNMTVARGCTEGEAGAAAYKLGRAVIEHGITLSFGNAGLEKEWAVLREEKRRLAQEWARLREAQHHEEPYEYDESENDDPDIYCVGWATCDLATDRAMT